MILSLTAFSCALAIICDAASHIIPYALYDALAPSSSNSRNRPRSTFPYPYLSPSVTSVSRRADLLFSLSNGLINTCIVKSDSASTPQRSTRSTPIITHTPNRNLVHVHTQTTVMWALVSESPSARISATWLQPYSGECCCFVHPGLIMTLILLQ